MNLDYTELVKEVKEWEIKNFGPARLIAYGFKYPHQPLLGIIEECGELSEAIDYDSAEAVIDGIGDIIIFMIDYCIQIKLSFVEIIEEPYVPQIGKSINIILGKLCHSHLKYEQGIRDTEKNHLQDIKTSLIYIVFKLKDVCDTYNFNLDSVIHDTWEEVKQRDWTKDRMNGGV